MTPFRHVACSGPGRSQVGTAEAPWRLGSTADGTGGVQKIGTTLYN